MKQNHDFSFKYITPEILTVISTVSLFFLPNTKAYIAVFVFYAAGLFLFNGFSLLESLFLTLTLALPFERGIRDWLITVVAKGPQPWMPEYAFYFKIAPKLIFTVLVFLLTLFSSKRIIPKKPWSLADWLLVVFLFFTLLSTALSENLQLSIIGFIRLMSTIFVYFMAKELLSSVLVRKMFLHIFLTILGLFGFVGTLQFFLGRPIGLFLEDAGSGSFGYVTTEGEKFYRVMGFTGHPTFFASVLCLLIPVAIGIALNMYRQKITKKLDLGVVLFTGLFGLIALFATYSRSGWMAMGVSLIFFLKLIRSGHKKINFPSIVVLLLFTGLSLVAVVPIITSRLQTIPDFLQTGAGSGRIDLIEQAVWMIKESPIFGVGLNNFTKIMAQNDLSPAARNFLYPVHNTFLLFLSELGIPAGILFIAFVFVSLKSSFAKVKNNLVNFGVWVGAFTFVINAQFHTLFNLDPSLDIFMVMLAYLTTI